MLSVIVPVYQVETYLPKCISSILSQSYQNLELILVDDGSPDRCPEICDEAALRDPRVRVIHQENGGQAVARNAALDLCRGEYIAFADSDDFVEPGAYEEMMGLLLKENVKMVCGGRYNVWEADGSRKPGLCPPCTQVISCEEMLTRIFTWNGCDNALWDKIYHRSLFASLRFPEESGSEDIALVYQLVLQAGQVAMLAKPVYNYLQRTGSTSYGKVNDKTFHFEKQAERLYRDICNRKPEVRQSARYLYVRGLMYSVLLLDLAGEEQRRIYSVQMQKSRKALRKEFSFLLLGPYFKPRERMQGLLMSLNLYRSLRKLIHHGT